MKLLFIFLILLNISYAFHTEKELQIGKHFFTMIQESYNEYGDKGITLTLSTKNRKKDASSVLSLILENQSGSCTATSAQVGAYEINGNTFTLYSHWERYKQESDAPIGDRIQIYEVDEQGILHKVLGKVYIEKYDRSNGEVEEGMKYLYTEAKTMEEKLALERYKASVEHIFKADFVMGKEIKKLAMQVYQALKRKQKQRWQ